MSLDVIRMTGARPYPPRVSEFTRRFWEELRTGRFLSTRCKSCSRYSFPPKPFCPHCWAREVDWTPLSTRGIVYSSTVVHAAPEVFMHETPYRVAIVDLLDGVRVATRLVESTDFAIGREVDIVVLEYDDGPLFAARPI